MGVERALSEILTDHRIVVITLPSGGEMQLCLRVDRRVADRETEIEALHARLRRRARAWRLRLELADLCYHSGQWEAAREAYRQAVALNPTCFAASTPLTFSNLVAKSLESVETAASVIARSSEMICA